MYRVLAEAGETRERRNQRPPRTYAKPVTASAPNQVWTWDINGEAMVDGDAHALVLGAVVYLAHGQTLSIHNRSETEPLRYLIIKALSA